MRSNKVDCVVCGKGLRSQCKCPWSLSFEENDQSDKHSAVVFMNTIRAMVFDKRNAEEAGHH